MAWCHVLFQLSLFISCSLDQQIESICEEKEESVMVDDDIKASGLSAGSNFIVDWFIDCCSWRWPEGHNVIIWIKEEYMETECAPHFYFFQIQPHYNIGVHYFSFI